MRFFLLYSSFILLFALSAQGQALRILRVQGTPVNGDVMVYQEGLLRAATSAEVFDYTDDGTAFVPYLRTDVMPHIWDKIPLLNLQATVATVVTVAALPASPALGQQATITDGNAGLAWGATAVHTGGGATRYLVWFNGTNWTVMGK